MKTYTKQDQQKLADLVTERKMNFPHTPGKNPYDDLQRNAQKPSINVQSEWNDAINKCLEVIEQDAIHAEAFNSGYDAHMYTYNHVKKLLK